MKLIIMWILFVAILVSCQQEESGKVESTATQKQAIAHKPKNIILMISDGAGYEHFRASSLFQTGVSNGLAFQKKDWVQFPLAHYSLDSLESKGYDELAVMQDATHVNKKPTDSAASGTAFSSGKKVKNGSINMGENGDTLKTVTTAAYEAGKLSGVVASVQWSHATPATMVAHNSSRQNYAEIAREMLTAAPVDFIAGAGHFAYNDNGVLCENEECTDKYVGGKAFFDSISSGYIPSFKNAQWTTLEAIESIDSLAKGLKAATLPTLITARVKTTLQMKRGDRYDVKKNPDGDTAEVAYSIPFNTGIPTLAQLSMAAVNALQNEKGFFLMIEGGAVDWAGHANNMAALIEEQVDFNNAVDSVLGWVAANGGWEENLVIVTADHETGYLTGPSFSVTAQHNGTEIVLVDTVSVSRVASDTDASGKMPLHSFNSPNHTNQLVPLYAKGVGSELFAQYANEQDSIRGAYLQNNEVGMLLHRLLQ